MVESCLQEKEPDNKLLAIIAEKERELKRILFKLKIIENLEPINKELTLLTLVNEKTSESLFIAFPLTNKEWAHFQILWLEAFFTYMEGSMNNENIGFKGFEKILQKLSCLSPIYFAYNFSLESEKHEAKKSFLDSIKKVSVSELREMHLGRRKNYLNKCCQNCQKVFQEIKTGNLKENLISKFLMNCKNIACTNRWDKDFEKNRKAYNKEQDRVILFWLNQLLIKNKDSSKSDFILPFVTHQFLWQKRYFSLFFSRTENSRLEEISSLIFASINHNLNLLASTFIDIIEHFYSNEMSEMDSEKVFQFEIKLDDKPDISISPKLELNKKTTIEITESSLFTLTKRKGNRIKGDSKKYFDKFLARKLEEWENKGINNMDNRLETLKPLEDFKEIKKVTRNQWCYFIEFEKIPTLDDLVENIIKDIKKKNNKTKYEFDTLLIFAPLPFSICIKNSEKDEIVKEEEAQKLYLQVHLKEKIIDDLKRAKTIFKFSYLVISFHHSPMVCLEEIIDKEKNNVSHSAKFVSVTNLYIETNWLTEEAKNNSKLKNVFEESRNELTTCGYDYNFLKHIAKPYTYVYFPRRK